MNYREEYERWCVRLKAAAESDACADESGSANQAEDREMAAELRSMQEPQVEDAFYRNLEFGTGGLRGTIGAGTNRMNRYTVAKASQGLDMTAA